MPISAAKANSIIGVVTSLIPEIMSIIRSYHTTHNSMPSDEFVINQLNIDVNRVIAISDAWLEAHPQTTPVRPDLPTEPMVPPVPPVMNVPQSTVASVKAAKEHKK